MNGSIHSNMHVSMKLDAQTTGKQGDWTAKSRANVHAACMPHCMPVEGMQVHAANTAASEATRTAQQKQRSTDL
jgi:hypothetical protein